MLSFFVPFVSLWLRHQLVEQAVHIFKFDHGNGFLFTPCAADPASATQLSVNADMRCLVLIPSGPGRQLHPIRPGS